ncbi:MAG: hypothetical protein ACKVQR_17305 [Aquabacterium sp.]
MSALPAPRMADPGWHIEAGLATPMAQAQEPAGLPIERLARLAARRTFVAMKMLFIDAVAGLAGERSAWLRHQVRQADDPIDLWLLRGLVFEALPDDGSGRHHRQMLERILQQVFPDVGALSAWRPLVP